MTHDSASRSSAAAAAKGRPSRLVLAARLAAIAVILLLLAALVHFVRHAGSLRGGTIGGEAGTDDSWPPRLTAEGTARAEHRPRPTTLEEASADLRRALAGLVMAAADEADEFRDPSNQDAESRRKFIAERFGLPYDPHRTTVLGDLAPAGATVLVTFESPDRTGGRMTLLRIRKDIHAALEDLHKQYFSAGWKLREPMNPKAQTDRGWMVRFSRNGQDRIVYARQRESARETLAAIYETRY